MNRVKRVIGLAVRLALNSGFDLSVEEKKSLF